jgi:hypothetical protein
VCAREPEIQPVVVGAVRRGGFIVSGLLFTMNGTT